MFDESSVEARHRRRLRGTLLLLLADVFDLMIACEFRRSEGRK